MNVENNERLHRFEGVSAGDVAYLMYRIEDAVARSRAQT